MLTRKLYETLLQESYSEGGIRALMIMSDDFNYE
ncbi:hypothetical protein ACUXI4_004217 [Pantoea piersonii]